jgi:diketogulonate reductase-like aldo/keto reductase
MNAQSTVTLLTGNKMPVIGLGTWRLMIDTPGTVQEALELGYRMIDTSGDYGTQPGVGEGIRQSGLSRDKLYIVTKIEETDDAYQATQHNVGEMGLEYADAILIHRPPKSNEASRGLWEGLIQAKKDGLTKDIGVSNYSIELMQYLIDTTGETPAVNQIEWSPFGHSQEMLAYCQSQGIAIQAYSPLTRAVLLGNPVLKSIADLYVKTPAQLLLRWNLQLGTIPIAKANRREHMEENLQIFDFEISDDDMATLNGLNEGHSSLGRLPYL